MIYTCTLNPSLDYYMEFDNDLVLGEINRSNIEYYEAGGKGINVSIVLNNLMIPNRAFGFLGGFTQDFFIDLLQKYEYIQPSFTYIDGHTRINLKLKGDTVETDLNAAGPYITPQAMDALKKKVSKLDEGDVLVFSGNAPIYLLDDVENMIGECASKNIRIVLDTNPNIIKSCLKYKPFLIKPSLKELEEILDEELVINDVKDLIVPLRKVLEMGGQNIIVQLGEKGSILVCDQGAFHTDIVQSEQIINTVGSGDSMVAGFIMNSLRSIDVVDSFRFASCCSIATSFSKGLATREKVNELYKVVEVTKID
ncbi:MAG: 1-phosphofructokinase family hexose kinase [Erysipelotrichaceae bacterium]|nr:1-phosphofructokinase family hexose kinase [Erysipelotrichaceae bacterium]